MCTNLLKKLHIHTRQKFILYRILYRNALILILVGNIENSQKEVKLRSFGDILCEYPLLLLLLLFWCWP